VATKTATQTFDGEAATVSWAAMGNADDGTPVPGVGLLGSVQFAGTFGSATVVLEGSNDGGTTYATIKDATGTAVSTGTAAIFSLNANVKLVRPRTSGGTGTSLNVTLFARYV